jgi:hypothetical protein
MARAEANRLTSFLGAERRTASDEEHHPSIHPANRLRHFARGGDFRDGNGCGRYAKPTSALMSEKPLLCFAHQKVATSVCSDCVRNML